MKQMYHHASFMLGAAKLSQLPPDRGGEVAFAGRSNAGKSSAINVITGVRSLARISKTPGRTQQINFFSLEKGQRIVDLPGYGYARVSQDVRLAWQQLVEKYLETRQSLRGLVVLMDVRHPLTGIDRHLLHWCFIAGLPVHVLLTKADKLSRGAATATLHRVRQDLQKAYTRTISSEVNQEHVPTAQLFSALKKTGVEEIHAKLDEWLNFG